MVKLESRVVSGSWYDRFQISIYWTNRINRDILNLFTYRNVEDNPLFITPEIPLFKLQNNTKKLLKRQVFRPYVMRHFAYGIYHLKRQGMFCFI